MKPLWAPWRMEYIEKNPDSRKKCIFCAKAAEKKDTDNHVICRRSSTFSLLNIYPYNNGHLMVAPYKHTGNMEDLENNVLEELMLLTRDMVALLKKTIHPEGFNVGLNIGKTAGAGITEHLHMHIVPRWNGDTNFMPAIGHTKVIPQSLKKMYTILQEQLNM